MTLAVLLSTCKASCGDSSRLLEFALEARDGSRNDDASTVSTVTSAVFLILFMLQYALSPQQRFCACANNQTVMATPQLSEHFGATDTFPRHIKGSFVA